MGIEKMEEMYYLSYITFLGAIMIQTKTYDNGLRIVVNKQADQNYVSCRFSFRVGSSDEKPNEKGLAHLVEHMQAGVSTKHRTREEIEKVLDGKAIEYNASTDTFFTDYFFDCLEEDFNTVFIDFAECVFEARFDQAEIDNEKNAIMQEWAEEREMEAYDAQCLKSCIITDGQIPSNLITGEKEQILGFSKQDCENFANRNYTAKNLIVSVSGNIDISEIEKLAEDKIIPILNKRTNNENEQVFVRKSQRNFPKIYSRKNLNKASEVEVVFPLSKHADFVQRARFILYSNIMGDGLSSRFLKDIRVDSGLAYRVDFDSLLEFGCFSIKFVSEQENVPKILAKLRKNINDVAINGFTKEEITREKAKIRLQLALDEKGNNSLAETMSRQLRKFGRTYSDDELIEIYKNITDQELQQFAKEVANCSDYTIFQSGKYVKDNAIVYFETGAMPQERVSIVQRFMEKIKNGINPLENVDSLSCNQVEKSTPKVEKESDKQI